jgi:hypothetical protein
MGRRLLAKTVLRLPDLEESKNAVAEFVGCGESPLAAGIRRVKGAKRLGVRIGNCLTIERACSAAGTAVGRLPSPTRQGNPGDLDWRGLRGAEPVAIKAQDFQIREEHWVIADMIG